MHELGILALVVVVMMAATAVTARWVGPALRVAEQVLLWGSILVIMAVMLFVCAEVLMRYAFNSPIPGHLELSEQLMPIIVFLPISYTQATHGHVGMDFLLDSLAPAAKRRARMATLFVSIFVCTVLSYFMFKNARQLLLYDDVTMSPPYYKTWPAAAAISLGYFMISIRMFIQVLHLYNPNRYPAYAPAERTFHAPE